MQLQRIKSIDIFLAALRNTGAVGMLICGALFVIPADGVANTNLQIMEMPASPNPVGSGARALGMGGAFIAIADDATAASWNPGGLIQLERPELSVVYGYTNRKERLHFENHPEASNSFSIDYADLNYLSAAYPFRFKHINMIVALTHQHLYDFHRDWRYPFQLEDASPTGTRDVANRTYSQDGALYATGLSYALQLSPALSAGITVNFWGDTLMKSGWDQQETVTSSNEMIPGLSIQHTTVLKEAYAFEGINFNIGFLWSINSAWTLGGVIKTPFTAEIDRDYAVRSETDYNNPAIPNDILEATDAFEEKLEMPLSYGIGIAYRHSDTLTLSMACYRTHWEDFIYENHEGKRTSPVSGKSAASSDIDATTWVRMGAEYLFIKDNIIISLFP